MGADLTWLSEIGLDTQAGTDFTGGPEKYLSAIGRFYKGYEKNRAKVEEAFAAKDYESYMITVHALKSNSRMIGAADLGNAFETLELAAKAGDAQTVEAQNAPTMEAYAQLVEKLSPIEGLGDVRAADEISAEMARGIAEKLLEALDDFDDELSRELAGKLAGYPFRITQRNRLKEAMADIEDFLYDEAAEIIREITAAIE